MLLTFYFTKTSMIDIFDLKYRFVPTQTQTTFCCSVTQSCLALSTPRTAACQASLSFTISWSFLKLMSIESVMPSNHLTLCCPLLLFPPFNLSQHQGLFQFSTSGGQSIGVSASASVLPLNIQDWFPLG